MFAPRCNSRPASYDVGDAYGGTRSRHVAANAPRTSVRDSYAIHATANSINVSQLCRLTKQKKLQARRSPTSKPLLSISTGFDMPGLIRKLLIFAAVDGLILQPYGNGSRHNGGNNDSSSIRIEYKTSKISSFPASALSDEIEEKQQDAGLEAYGLVGMWSLYSLVTRLARLKLIPILWDWFRSPIRCTVLVPHPDHSTATSRPDPGKPDLRR